MNVNQNDLQSGVIEGMKYILELDHLVHDRLRVEFYRSHAKFLLSIFFHKAETQGQIREVTKITQYGGD